MTRLRLLRRRGSAKRSTRRQARVPAPDPGSWWGRRGGELRNLGSITQGLNGLGEICVQSGGPLPEEETALLVILLVLAPAVAGAEVTGDWSAEFASGKRLQLELRIPARQGASHMSFPVPFEDFTGLGFRDAVQDPDPAVFLHGARGSPRRSRGPEDPRRVLSADGFRASGRGVGVSGGAVDDLDAGRGRALGATHAPPRAAATRTTATSTISVPARPMAAATMPAESRGATSQAAA